MLLDLIVGQEVRSQEAAGAGSRFCRIEIRLANDGHGVHARLEAQRVYIPDHDAIVGRVVEEEHLALIVDDDLPRRADACRSRSAIDGIETGLAQDGDRSRELSGLQCSQGFGADIEHHDAPARAAGHGSFRHEQALVDLIDVATARPAHVRIVELWCAEAFTEKTGADAADGMPFDGQAFVVHVVDVVAAVSVMPYQKSVVDLVQGHRTGSPDAVRRSASVGDATDQARVTV